VGRVDGTSRDNDRPAGVAESFQVRTHSVEPRLANRCRNLLSHDDRGTAAADKAVEFWPKVTLVLLPFAGARDGERLTWAGSGPKRSIVRPPSETRSE
jgi:hypothetical protein